MITGLDHIALAVTDLDRAVEGYQARYRVLPLYREVIEDQGVEEVMIALGGNLR